MIRFLADENFNGRIVRGLRARQPDIDIVRVQETELAASPDPGVLAWAAQHKRILLTHDIDTMTKYTYARMHQELPLAGVIFVRDTLAIAGVIDDLLLILAASQPEDWEGRADFLPL
jgi:predicted nuclease of predicted toxin-antitoxin system